MKAQVPATRMAQNLQRYHKFFGTCFRKKNCILVRCILRFQVLSLPGPPEIQDSKVDCRIFGETF